MSLRFQLRIERLAREPDPPYLIVANHCSGIDPLLVAQAVRAPVSFLCHQDLARNLVKRLWIRSLGAFFIRPRDVVHGAIAAALRRLAQRKAVCLFPEGTRSLDGRLLPLRTGGAFIALAAGVPVLPVAIVGTHRIMPVGTTRPRPGLAIVRVGPALRPPKEGPRVSRVLIREWTARFAEALSRLLPADQQPAAPPVPGTVVPGTRVPGTRVPGTRVPGTGVPGTGVPGTGVPGTAEQALKLAR